MRSSSEFGAGDVRVIIPTMHPAPTGGPILHLHFNRPRKRNALNLAMLEELHRCLSEPVGRIVLTSSGPSFCAGLDLDECRNDPAWPKPLRHLGLLANVYRRLLNNSATSIALVQGFAVGGGLGLAVCADVVIAASEVRLRLPETGELAALAHIVQPIIEARQAARRGAVGWQVGELDARAAQTAGLIDEIVEPATIAARREEALREFLPRLSQQPSWRTPERCRAIAAAMRMILTELSR